MKSLFATYAYLITASHFRELDLINLQQSGLKVLILDYDGVLTSHGEVELKELEAMKLNEAITLFGPGQVYILSNAPTTARHNYISNTFPGAIFVWAQAAKPNPQAVLEIIREQQVKGLEVVLVDDRLTTGILAAMRAGIKALYITKPLIDFKKHPVKEAWFYLLRRLERLFY